MTFAEQLHILFWVILLALFGAIVGQFAPGDLATLGEYFSPLRNEATVKFGAAGAALGLIAGILMVMACRQRK